MHDPFQRQLHRSLEFRLLNYRNGIHQGEVIANPLKRQGFGITLDHNFLLALGNWNDNSLQGQSFIIFPDSTYFYGTVSNKLPQKSGFYHSSPHLNIHSFINDNNQSIFIFDNPQNKTIRSITVSSKMMKKLVNQIKVNQNCLLQQYNRNQESQEILLSGEQKYQNIGDKWQSVQKMGNNSVPEHARSYEEYIETTASKEIELNRAKMQIVSNNQYFQFNFKDSSIKCRVNSAAHYALQIKNIGLFDGPSNSFQISKNYNYTNRTIEQNIAGKSFVYAMTPMTRPIQCLTELHLYYKKSLDYVNDYLKIDYLYRIKFIFTAFQTLFNSLDDKKSLRKPPQNITLSRSIYETQMTKQRKLQNDLDKKEDIQEIKYKVYQMARKKLSTHGDSRINKSPPRKVTLNDLKLSQYRSRSAEQAHVRRIGMLTQKKKTEQKEGKIILVNRSYAYLDQDSQKLKSYSKIFDSKQKEQTPQRHRKRQSEGQLSKYAYLEEQTKQYQKKKIENIKTLTRYYQEIERQLKKQSSTSNIKVKPKGKSKMKEPSDRSTAKISAQTKNEEMAMGPKRILKFGWQ